MKKNLILIAALITFAFLLNANEVKYNNNLLNNKNYFSFDVSKNSEFNDLQNYYQVNNDMLTISKKLYADEGTKPVEEISIDKKIKNATACGITGTVFFSLSWFLLIPGIAVMADGYNNRFKTSLTGYSTQYYDPATDKYYPKYAYNSTTSENWGEFAAGAGVFAGGLVFFLIGTPLMIAGWVLRAYYKNQKNKVSFFMERENDKNNLVLAIAL